MTSSVPTVSNPFQGLGCGCLALWNQVSSVTKVLIGFSVSPKRFLEATVPCRLSDLASKGWRTQVVTRALMLAAEMVQGQESEFSAEVSDFDAWKQHLGLRHA